MFPEGPNGGINVASGSFPINIGWDPVVMEVIANWDGGKTIVGFGKLSGTIYSSWAIKMWGVKGTKPCSDNSVISGYVKMVVGLMADLGANPTHCALASNAKVQWAWTNTPTNGLATSTTRWSVVAISATEEYVFGGDAATGTAEGDDPYIIIAGGSTFATPEAYGMNSWSWFGEFIDYNGVTATASVLTSGTTTPVYKIPLMNSANNYVYFDGTDDAKGILNAPTAANHCWTAVHNHPGATDTARAALGGFAGSIVTCL